MCKYMSCRHLQIAHHELKAAQTTIQNKAQRHAIELEERKMGPQRARDNTMKQLEADKIARKDR